MAQRVKVADVLQLGPGTIIPLEVDGQRIALANVEGTYYAIHGACTHVGGPLGEGTLEGAVVTCPWHRSQFDVRTGSVLRPPAQEPVRTYPVTVEGSDIMVELAAD